MKEFWKLVIRDLMGNWNCTRERAMELVKTPYGEMVITEAELCQSLPYYPAKQIGEHENLVYSGMLDDKKKIMDVGLVNSACQAAWWLKCKEHYDNCFIPDCLLCLKFEQWAIENSYIEED